MIFRPVDIFLADMLCQQVILKKSSGMKTRIKGAASGN